ncbi:hypothetical protein [Proteus mirabilis]|uniref:hypothetical protein n=1 Tax=Proteus mirabilis TaxID=584 RepID=UPI001BAE8472|nr:hypothetical protein [Proteus mirabilis]MBS3842464.1 hypothetical protein [Proteus mirabilis]
MKLYFHFSADKEVLVSLYALPHTPCVLTLRSSLGLLGRFGQSLNSRHLGTHQHCPYGIYDLGHYVNTGASSYLYPQQAARSEHLSAYCVRLVLANS